jgi:hypothetical protein
MWNDVQEQDTHLFFFPPIFPDYRQEPHVKVRGKQTASLDSASLDRTTTTDHVSHLPRQRRRSHSLHRL